MNRLEDLERKEIMKRKKQYMKRERKKVRIIKKESERKKMKR